MTFDITELLPRFLLRDRKCYAIAKGIEAGLKAMDTIMQDGVKLLNEEMYIWYASNAFTQNAPAEWLIDEMAWAHNIHYNYQDSAAKKFMYLGTAYNGKKYLGTKIPLEYALRIYNLGASNPVSYEMDSVRTMQFSYQNTATDAEKKKLTEDVKNIFSHYVPVCTTSLTEDSYVTLVENYKDRTDITEMDLDFARGKYATGFNGVFSGCTNLKTCRVDGIKFLLSSDTVTMEDGFKGCTALEGVDISSWNLGNTKALMNMFYGCGTVNTFTLNISGMDFGNVPTIYSSFMGMKKLKLIANGTRNVCAQIYDLDTLEELTYIGSEDILKKVNPRVKKIKIGYKAISECFVDPDKLARLNRIVMERGWELFTDYKEAIKLYQNVNVNEISLAGVPERMVHAVNGLESMMIGNQYTESVHDLGAINWTYITSLQGTFARATNLKTVDLSGCKLSKVKDWSMAFMQSALLQSVQLNGAEAAKPTTMYMMFSGCSNIMEIDMSEWDFSALTNTNLAFTGCYNLTSVRFGRKGDIGAAGTALTIDLSMCTVDFDTLNDLMYALATVESGTLKLSSRSVLSGYQYIVTAIQNKGWTVEVT